MTYAGIHMFMDKLKQLINCKDNPLFNNHAIIRERPQLQLLYEDLGSMAQTLFIDKHQDLEKLNDLKQRFVNAAEEAQYIIDLFLSCLHIRNNGYFTKYGDLSPSLKLDDVRTSFKSVELEFMSMRIDSMKMDSTRRPERKLNQPQTSISRYSQGSKKLLDKILVGLDHDAELIRDKLVEDQKKLDVVSIVGMGGIGKTTLATKVFNDGYVQHHFHIRVWVTVSQTYDKRAVMIQILESIPDQLNLEKDSDARLRLMVHKHLMSNRYLIVIDDIWHIETWNNLKLLFSHDNNGSRILLTSRLTEVAKHASLDGLIYHLGYLNKERSWELLCQKVFQGNEFPEWSIKPGMQIVETCKGLPLAVVVIAGVLAKEAWSEKFWVEIADRTGSYIVDQNGCLETLALSYNHLPLHLRECFLYLGGFPEDYEFEVQRLTWLWVAEGFIQQDGDRSLEDIAEGYLKDLIERNLVIVFDRKKSDGGVKACKVHDLVRELCLKKAREERFIIPIEELILRSQSTNIITQQHKPVRTFTNKDIYVTDFPYTPTQILRSILCFHDLRSLSAVIAKCFRSFALLTVLDLQNSELQHLPRGMELLVNLRYLAIWTSSTGFASSICNLWNLQTLIYITSHVSNFMPILLPRNISNLINLRHLWSYLPTATRAKRPFLLLCIEKPMNLHTISDVVLEDGVHNYQKYFPFIKELKCHTYVDEEMNFKSLRYLEKLKLRGLLRSMPLTVPKGDITLPATLKTLSLSNYHLPWSEMSIIQSLPNLQVLKLKNSAFEGSCWNTDEHVFPQLKFLRLEMLNIKEWEAYSPSFPCLRQLEIFICKDLEEIPFEIGEIPTLELIKIKKCRHSVGESVRRIQEEQQNFGNYDLKIDI